MSCREWTKVRLGDIIEFNPRESISKKQKAKKVGMEKLKPFTRFIDEYEFEEFNGGTKFKNGDTLLARITPCLENGKTSQVTILDDNEVGFGSTEYIVLREKTGVTDKDYIYYLSISPKFRDIAIKSMVGSSGRQRVQQDVLESIILLLPPIAEQKAIADTLSCLDDKIELNNRINKNIEEMAQAIFKSWFVDFEPFQDGEFEDSELGRIPKGWRVGTLGDLISDTIGGDWGKEIPQGNYSEEVVCIRGADIPEIASGKKGKPPIRYILKKNMEKKRLSRGQIIIEISGGSPTQSTGRTALITQELVNIAGRTLVCTNFCRVLSMKKELYVTFVYSMLQYLYNKDLFFLYENGTTGIKNLDINNLFNKHLIILPDDDTMARYKEIFDTIINLIYQNGAEINKLETIRDSLLPKLISGEIRVPIEETGRKFMSIDVNPKVISELRAIAENYAISKIVVFGSRARGDNNSKSDIDIAVYPLAGFENEGHFVSDIDDLETLLKFDIIFVNKDTDEKLVANIQKEGVVIYERLHTET